MINGVGGEVLSFVVVAGRIFGLRVVNVLPVRGSGVGGPGSRPSSIVTAVVGHAFAERVGHLILQAVARRLLEYGLQRIVHHPAVGLRAGNGATTGWVNRCNQSRSVAI